MCNRAGVCKLIRFGRYTLDRQRSSLIAAGNPIALRPKSFNVLVYLVENPGRVVSKDELGEAVWPGVPVSDESLTKSVSEVRLALGDSIIARGDDRSQARDFIAKAHELDNWSAPRFDRTRALARRA